MIPFGMENSGVLNYVGNRTTNKGLASAEMFQSGRLEIRAARELGCRTRSSLGALDDVVGI